MTIPIPPPPRPRRPDPGGEGAPALAKVATQHEARARHPTVRGGRPPQPPQARALKGSPLAWSIVIGIIAASAVLWGLLIVALFGALAEFLRLQADIVTQLGRITIVQCDTSGYGCDVPYGPAGRIGGTS